MSGKIPNIYPSIEKFIREFNSFPVGYLFIDEHYYPHSIRGLCNYLEFENYVKYDGNNRWIKRKDISSVDTVLKDMEAFVDQYKKTTGNNIRIVRSLLKNTKK
jgi:hypothetical protein